MNTVTETADNSDDDDDDGSGVRLYQSIYETALRNKVPATVIEDMVRIYSYDVDFQRKVQPGDSFDVFYAGEDEGATITEKTEVLFASLTVGGETKKYYRFQTPDDSVVDYYDETGKSAKKFLVRKPVNNAIMRSGFGGRRHPILGYVKMHTGVDWATAYGTPIFASGNGVVEKVGPEGGYGKYVRLKHNNGYETAYGHMSAFAKGMEARQAGTARPGDRLRRFDRAIDRPPRPLRNPGQRPVRRPDARQTAARPFARGPCDGQFREGTRSPRRPDEQSRQRCARFRGHRLRAGAAGQQSLSLRSKLLKIPRRARSVISRVCGNDA